MIYENVRKICDHFYFVHAVRRFVLKYIKHDRKLKHEKHDVLRKAAGLRFKSYSTCGLVLPILVKLRKP